MFNRFDLYGPVHKGLRLALSGLAFQANATASYEKEKVEAFIEEFRRVTVILNAHSRDEDTHINESYEKFAPDTLKELEQEHHGLEHKLEELAALVDRMELSASQPAELQRVWYDIGKGMNRFTADYLIHLEREEGPGMKALWENLTDEQIKVISKNIRSSIPPHAMIIFMHYIIPAISHPERVGMFSEMKQFAPKEAFAGMMGIAQNRLDPSGWNELQAALEAAAGATEGAR